MAKYNVWLFAEVVDFIKLFFFNWREVKVKLFLKY